MQVSSLLRCKFISAGILIEPCPDPHSIQIYCNGGKFQDSYGGHSRIYTYKGGGHRPARKHRTSQSLRVRWRLRKKNDIRDAVNQFTLHSGQMGTLYSVRSGICLTGFTLHSGQMETSSSRLHPGDHRTFTLHSGQMETAKCWYVKANG